MHALIIEDEPMIAMGIEDILRECGFTSFDLASSPGEALNSVSRLCPDLITSDVQLNPGNGIETVLRICSATPIPVIFITGNVADVAQRLLEVTTITKPFTETNLRQPVVRAMTNHPDATVLILKEEFAQTKEVKDGNAGGAGN